AHRPVHRAPPPRHPADRGAGRSAGHRAPGAPGRAGAGRRPRRRRAGIRAVRGRGRPCPHHARGARPALIRGNRSRRRGDPCNVITSLSLTRRSLLGAAAAALLAGCARDVHAAGPPGGLVTLDGTTAALALLLGRDQVGTASFLSADPLLTAVERLQGSPVTDVSGAGGEIDVERLAALRPQRLVGFRPPGGDGVLDGLAPLHTVER